MLLATIGERSYFSRSQETPDLAENLVRQTGGRRADQLQLLRGHGGGRGGSRRRRGRQLLQRQELLDQLQLVRLVVHRLLRLDLDLDLDEGLQPLRRLVLQVLWCLLMHSGSEKRLIVGK